MSISKTFFSEKKTYLPPSIDIKINFLNENKTFHNNTTQLVFMYQNPGVLTITEYTFHLIVTV